MSELIPETESPRCQVLELANPAVCCPMPATFQATRYVDWMLCRDHAILALIAGWQPKEITH